MFFNGGQGQGEAVLRERVRKFGEAAADFSSGLGFDLSRAEALFFPLFAGVQEEAVV